MAEWLNAPVLKTGERESVSGVRIPILPQEPYQVVLVRLFYFIWFPDYNLSQFLPQVF
jgi:hypothetical protein